MIQSMSIGINYMFFILAKNLIILLEVHYGFYFPTQVLNLANIWFDFC